MSAGGGTRAIIAALLAIPAALVLLRHRRDAGDRAEARSWLSLDGLWTAVPIVLLVALIAFAAAA